MIRRLSPMPPPLKGEGAHAAPSNERGRKALLRQGGKSKRSYRASAVKPFTRYRFKRQLRIDHDIGDFFCLSRRLIVEGDGAQHAKSATEARREVHLTAQGFPSVGFCKANIFENEEGVLTSILNALKAPLPARLRRASPPPLKAGGTQWSDHG